MPQLGLDAADTGPGDLDGQRERAVLGRADGEGDCAGREVGQGELAEPAGLPGGRHVPAHVGAASEAGAWSSFGSSGAVGMTRVCISETTVPPKVS